jgi:hypothetical protein
VTKKKSLMIFAPGQSSFERDIFVKKVGEALWDDGNGTITVFLILDLDVVLADAVAQNAHLAFVILVPM